MEKDAGAGRPAANECAETAVHAPSVGAAGARAKRGEQHPREAKQEAMSRHG